jgi:branched-chain amino acid transport system substrate-binding protein
MSRFTARGKRSGRGLAVICTALALTAACGGSRAADNQDSAKQSSAKEIKIGGSFPFSGPYAAFSNGSKAIAAYFACVNKDGGVNGRKIVYSAADDAYDPARLTANARKAVEQDKDDIFMAFGGTNVAIQPYMNENKVPQIVLAGNTEFSNVTKFPFTHAWWPDLTWEANYTTQYVMSHPKEFPDPKIGLIALNNTLADSHIGGTTAALGKKADTVFPKKDRIKVEPTQADWTSQLNQLKADGVNVLYMNPGTAGQISAMKYIKQVGWKVKTVLYSGSASFTTVLKPAGFPAATGDYTPAWLKDPADPQWTDDAAVKEYRATLTKCGKDVDANSYLTANGYAAAEAVVKVLDSMGSEPITGDAFNKAWMSVDNVDNGLLMPGSTMTAGPKDGRLVHSYQMEKFDGTTWQPVDKIADVRTLGITE